MNDIHFDAIIVGSGFGGSVMAYRLAQAGLEVCLLERGKAYPPGSSRDSPRRGLSKRRTARFTRSGPLRSSTCEGVEMFRVGRCVFRSPAVTGG